MAALTEAEFSRHLNTDFDLSFGDEQLQLSLVAVKPYLPQPNEQPGMERFSVFFEESKKFPSEEKFSLTDQIRRSSRSVAANIGEGYRKKQYLKMFISKMADADGEATETQVWIDFANKCGYLSTIRQTELRKGYE